MKAWQRMKKRSCKQNKFEKEKLGFLKCMFSDAITFIQGHRVAFERVIP
jgi:hypothetical protein